MSILTDSEPIVRAPSPYANEAPWQAELRSAVRDPHQLCRLLELPDTLANDGLVASATRGHAAHAPFPLLVPRSYLRRIESGNPDDPLLRQVLPTAAETADVPGFACDPVGDLPAALAPGLLKKYTGRALLVTTGACGVHCRYCFRRNFPYADLPKSDEARSRAVEAIARDDSVGEVILSGGDPLMLVDRRLIALARQIAAIPHVQRLRIHTRMPVVIPSRVTAELVEGLAGLPLTVVVVIHANCAQELSEEVVDALVPLRRAGILLLNQAVLLRGVNDTPQAQAALSERLLTAGVLPYYLHQLDRARGVAHFEVPVDVGRQIVAALRERLPGYAVPRYVQEVPGEACKIPLA